MGFRIPILEDFGKGVQSCTVDDLMPAAASQAALRTQTHYISATDRMNMDTKWDK